MDELLASIGIGFGLLVMLSIWGLIALVLFSSARTPQTFPLSFRRESDDSLIHPDEWRQLARRVGFRRGRSLPLHLRIAVESTMAETGWGETKITDVMYRRARGGTFVLCNYRREARHSSDKSDWIEIRHETLLIYTARRARFPTFHVAPNYRPNRLFCSILGKPWYHSNDDPGFHEQLNLYASAPEVVRPLLSDSVRASLKASAGLVVSVHGRNVIIRHREPDHGGGLRTWSFSGGRINIRSRRRRFVTSRALDPADWPKFLRIGLRVINAIRRSERATRQQRPGAAEYDMREAAANGGPGYGLLPRQEIDRFLTEDPPRRLSKALRRATRSRIAPWIKLVGWIFVIGPALLAGVYCLAGFPEGTAVLLIPGAGVLFGIGLITVPTWKRMQINGLLKHGNSLPARVVRVHRTNTSIVVGHAKYRRYDATLAYSIDGDTFHTEIDTYCDQARRAAFLAQNGKPTRVLVAPENGSRLFWIGGLVLE